MAHKLYDLTVKTGEYQDGQGQTKGRYENVGSVMQGDKGQFLILKRTFNPAGVPNPECKDSVLISCFEPQNSNQHQNNNQSQQHGGYQSQQQAPQQQQQGGYAPQQGGYQSNRG